jgi:hypothetical protein
VGEWAKKVYGIGEGPAKRVSLSLREATVEAIRARMGKRQFSAFITDGRTGVASQASA